MIPIKETKTIYEYEEKATVTKDTDYTFTFKNTFGKPITIKNISVTQQLNYTTTRRYTFKFHIYKNEDTQLIDVIYCMGGFFKTYNIQLKPNQTLNIKFKSPTILLYYFRLEAEI